jgi:hypothetical protein
MRYNKQKNKENFARCLLEQKFIRHSVTDQQQTIKDKEKTVTQVINMEN